MAACWGGVGAKMADERTADADRTAHSSGWDECSRSSSVRYAKLAVLLAAGAAVAACWGGVGAEEPGGRTKIVTTPAKRRLAS